MAATKEQVLASLAKVPAPNGTPITLALQGVPGFAYRVETSTNLSTWVPFTNFTSTNQVMYFQDTPRSSRKFYRAVTQ